MIINRIYIKHFGGLSDFSLTLSDGFNLVFGHNEDGKTTVMSFLRMMFYSTGTAKGDVNLNLRKRFTPFSGEKAGGEVEFTHEGKTYLLCKQFGKSAHTDKVSLMDVASGTEIPVSGDVGEKFFSLSWEAFERSIFIGSLQSDGKGAAELSKKLKSAVYTGDVGDSYEEISKRLTDAQGALRTKKRVGVSDRLEDRLSLLEQEKLAAKQAEDRRRENRTQADALEKSVASVYSRRDELKKLETASRNAQLHNALEAELEQRHYREELKTLLVDFSLEKAELCEKLLSETEQLDAKIKAEKSVLYEITDEDSDMQNDELVEALDRLSTLDEQLIAEKSSADTQKPAKGNGAVRYFLPALIFAMSACAGFAIKWFFLMLIPAALLAVFGTLALKKRGDEKRKNELLAIEKATRLARLEDERRAANDRYIILSERKKLKDNSLAAKKEEAFRRSQEIEKLAAESVSKNAALRELLKIDTTRDIKDAVLEKRTLLNRLAECDRLLEQSAHRTLGDSEIKEMLSNTPREELQPAEIYADEIIKAERDAADKVAALEKLRAESENLRNTHRGVAEIETEIAEKQKLLAEQNRHFNALALAAEVLSQANEEMRQNFAPELNRLTSSLLSRITNGKHDRVAISQELALTVNEDGAMPFSSDYLSAGSTDQADLCLRLAIAQITSGENRLPLLLDDVFAQYDDARAREATEFIADYSQNRQVLLFTCHGYFKTLAQDSGATIVTMKNE